MDYIYLGDRLTDIELKKKKCSAVKNNNNKCIRSRLSTMLVIFENGERHIILARMLRKINK